MSSSQKPDWAMSKRERAAAERAAQGLAPKRRRLWPWLVAGALVVAGAGAWFVQSGQMSEMQAAREAAEAEAAEAAAPRPVVLELAPFEVAKVTPGPLRETLKITGSLAPVRQVHLSAEVSGRVLEVKGRAGDTVAAGDLLVAFDTEALSSQLDQAMAQAEATRVQLEQARTDYERTKNLVERELAPNTALEKARSALDQLTATLAAQETQVANARRSVEKATVTAPFAGVIAERAIDPGQFAATGTPLLTLVDLTKLEVEAAAPVSQAPRLAPGQAVDLSVEGLAGRSFAGRVERLSPVTTQGSRMLPVFVSIDNADGALRGGMFASGRIVMDEKPEGIGLPAGAVRRDIDGQHVLVVEAGTALRRAVEVARDWDGGAVVEIAAGLAPGEVVVVEPLPELKPGMNVVLVE